MKQLVIFDLDGTLVDTIKDLAKACNYALQNNGFPTHHVSSYQFYVGNGVTRLIERALPSDAVTTETVEAVRNCFMEYYNLHYCDESQPYQGIPDLLQRLKSMDIKMAVASNKYQSAVENIVSHLFPDVPWVAVEGQKPNVNVKPDPSVVFEVLSKSPTPKTNTVMVGDSGVDMETARRACIESVGVTWGFRPESEIVGAGADHIIHSPLDLLYFLLFKSRSRNKMS